MFTLKIKLLTKRAPFEPKITIIGSKVLKIDILMFLYGTKAYVFNADI